MEASPRGNPERKRPLNAGRDDKVANLEGGGRLLARERLGAPASQDVAKATSLTGETLVPGSFGGFRNALADVLAQRCKPAALRNAAEKWLDVSLWKVRT